MELEFNIINAAKFNGAYPVIGIDISGAKILFAKKNGADLTYKISKNNSLEQILFKNKKKISYRLFNRQYRRC